jgi:predicted nuclease with RNAse H fold
MRTIGIDLSADRSKTAMSILHWGEGEAVVGPPLLKCTDAVLLDEISGLRPGDQAGVDTPFGWPAEFVRAVQAHLSESAWPGRGQDSERYRKDSLRYRRTDRIVRDLIRPASPPLPAPFDRIGAMVARWAHLEDELNNRGLRVDRTGCEPVSEVYPKASRHQWKLLDGPRRMDTLLDAAPWLQCDTPTQRAYEASEHAFDALICALTARAVARGLTAKPGPADLDDARVEGWIHLPEQGSLPLLPQQNHLEHTTTAKPGPLPTDR